MLLPLLASLLVGCADPAKDKSVATVAEPTAPPPAAAPASPPPAASAALTRLPASGSVGFTGAKVTKSHDGSFSRWSGTIDMNGMDVAGIQVEVQLDSVDTGIEKLNTHLVSPDFFDVAQFPKATFVSSAVRAGAPADSKLAGATHTVEGDLTMHGVTKTLTFPAIITVSPDAVLAKTEFAINRKDFKIEYPGKPDDLIKDEVVLKVDVITNRANVAPMTPPPGMAPAAVPGVPPAGAPAAPTTTP